MSGPVLHRAANASRDKSYAVDPYEWLSRPSKRIGVEPSIPVWELVCCSIVAAMIGAMLAIGGVL